LGEIGTILLYLSLLRHSALLSTTVGLPPRLIKSLDQTLSVNISTLPMALPHSARKYDLVVFGASGYTGKLTAEEVPVRTPSNLKWAIAGRSSHKLELIASDLNRRFPDRVPVGTWWRLPSTKAP
jgi:hypothetical protein